MSNSREVAKQAFDLLQKSLEESEARIAELSEELRHKRPTKNGLQKRLDILTHRLENSNENRERWKIEAGHLEGLVEHANAKVNQLKAKLEIAESGPDQVTKKEINYWRAKVESFDTQTAEYKARIVTLRQDVNDRDDELRDVRAALSSHDAAASTAQHHAEAQKAETSQEQELRAQINVARENAEAARAQNARVVETLERQLKEREAKLQELTARINAGTESTKAAKAERAQDTRTAATLEKKLKEREAELQELAAQINDAMKATKADKAERAQTSRAAVTLNEQLKEREAERREAQERAENLSEVANERLDQLNKFREQCEEAEERQEEAEWRLGKAQHFERLVQRRKNLISSLIATIRSKAKANTALKAGLDSVRRHKASAEESEQKLLAQIEQLTSELGAVKEANASAKNASQRSQDTVISEKEITESRARISELNERVNTQAELITSLEDDLQLSKLIQRDLNNKTADAQTEAQLELTQQQKVSNKLLASSQNDQEKNRLV
ncbi:MAG: hypothetical protein O6930_07155, partial [Gammaproteobacteria bacterium]|nr:hypothetical protein [Gammaproteobacteria bacterium]